MAGRRVDTLHAGPQVAGTHAVTWNGTDSEGRRVASGVYLFRMQAGGRTYVTRGTLLE